MDDIVFSVGLASDYKIGGHDDDAYRESKLQQIVSIIECQPWKEDGSNQLHSYMFRLLEARSDMTGLYGVAIRPHGYRIFWADASGIVASDQYTWDDLIPLVSYAYSLYVPPPGHYLRDSSIKLSPESLVKGEALNPKSKPFLSGRSVVGNSWGRRTHVFQHVNSDGEIITLKDANHVSGRINKHELPKQIHEHGTFRVPPFEVPDTETAQPAMGSFIRDFIRTKTRVLMGHSGEEIEKTETVLDILMATYDANEGTYQHSSKGEQQCDRSLLHWQFIEALSTRGVYSTGTSAHSLCSCIQSFTLIQTAN